MPSPAESIIEEAEEMGDGEDEDPDWAAAN
jgi:hypothetical protein